MSDLYSPGQAASVVAALMVAGMLAGVAAGNAAVARVTDSYDELDLFARVFATVQADYFDEVPPAVLVEAAIVGMTRELDSQSRWLSAEQLQDLRDDTEGGKTGIGVSVRRVDEGVEVVSVLPDSPARRDGVEPGDRIVAVDGTPIGGMPLGELGGVFDGLRGESATLSVVRDGVPLQITTVRERVPQPAVTVERIGDVVYARIEQFQGGVAADLEAMVRGAADVSTARGLVLDLRDNPGGLLSEAVAVSDLFLDEGRIVATRGRPGGETDIYDATPGGFQRDLPVAVLINGMSASASEIVASALQETGRAPLVGETTYGKGTVQKVYTMLDPVDPEHEAALKLTVGWYTTPSGAPVATREGRAPDVAVAFPRPLGPKARLEERIQRVTDPVEAAELAALAAALPNDRPEPAAIPWDLPAAERADADPQLQAAIRALPSR